MSRASTAPSAYTLVASGFLPDVASLPPDAMLTRAQVSALSGFAVISLKVWATKPGRGPRITRVEGRPRYRAADVAAWLKAS